jgi:hypothetical protein
MRVMMFEEGHPNVTLEDWQAFIEWQKICKQWSVIDKVIDRSECCIPDWFVPLARGVAIASDALMRRVGQHPGSDPPHWLKFGPDCFGGLFCSDCTSLEVRKFEGTNLWTVERCDLDGGRHDEVVLVHIFASTPIFTRSHQSAMRLAMHCHANGPPFDLRWIKTVPNNKQAAIEFARKRRNDEALGANNAQPDGQLH